MGTPFRIVILALTPLIGPFALPFKLLISQWTLIELAFFIAGWALRFDTRGHLKSNTLPTAAALSMYGTHYVYLKRLDHRPLLCRRFFARCVPRTLPDYLKRAHVPPKTCIHERRWRTVIRHARA